MLVTNDLCRFNAKQNYRRLPVQNVSNPQNTTLYSTQNFCGGIRDLLKVVFKKKPPLNPLEQAVKFMTKGNEATDIEHAYGQYIKAQNVLVANWEKLDAHGQKQYIQTMYAIASCNAADNTSAALGTYQNLVSNLKKSKSPFAKDKDIIGTVTYKVYQLGNLAIKRKSLTSAKNCYVYTRDLASYYKDTFKLEPTVGKENLIGICDKKINALNTIMLEK